MVRCCSSESPYCQDKNQLIGFSLCPCISLSLSLSQSLGRRWQPCGDAHVEYLRALCITRPYEAVPTVRVRLQRQSPRGRPRHPGVCFQTYGVLCTLSFTCQSLLCYWDYQSFGASDGSNIYDFDDTVFGLHTSILYTCCHTAEEVRRLRTDVLEKLDWESFNISYSDVGCNVDMHDPDRCVFPSLRYPFHTHLRILITAVFGTIRVYLHAMPDKAGQRALLSLTQKINEAMIKQDIPVHHPRKSLFHMTLARVKRSYPADKAVMAAKRMVFAQAGLRLRFCRFTFDGHTINSKDAMDCL